MKHTYILEQGKWKVSGKYYINSQQYAIVKGESESIHEESEWLLIATLHLAMDNPLEFYSKYLIKPINPNEEFTFWRSHNPLFGHILGKLMIIDDIILSSFQSNDRQYTGTECLQMIDDNFYKNWGFAFHEANKHFSWVTEIRKYK